MRVLYVVLFSFVVFLMDAQPVKPFQIYSSKGKKVTFEKMVRKLDNADVILFGEFHNNSIGHWLQWKLASKLVLNKNLVLGAEMFEADNQDVLTSYINGNISEGEFYEQMRLWSNYKTDYAPLVKLAKTNGLSFIATNVPRRYASQVYKIGVASLDSLSLKEKTWIAPLPFPYDANLSSYKKMLTMFDDEHVNENLPKAQAIKDATMAYFVEKNVKKDSIFLHFNGSYHSDRYEGIGWYLRYYNPTLKIITITMVEEEDVNKFNLENLDLADFIIAIDSDIPKTF